MIPHILHFTLPKTPSRDQLGVIEKARATHPDWRIMEWRDPLDPSEFRLGRYWANANTGAQLADLIRLDVVFKYGGIYLDSDFDVLRPLTPIADSCSFFVSTEDGRLATNAAFGAEPGHPALDALIQELINSPPDWSSPPNETTGPELFSRILKWRSEIVVLPRTTFYPYNWDEAARPPDHLTYAVHEWAGSWKTEKKPKPSLKRWLRAKSLQARAGRKYDERFIRRTTPKCESYSCAGDLVRRTAHGQFLLLAGDDLSITPEIYTNGFYELKEELFLKRALRGGDYFVDVGANIGSFTVLAASIVGPFGRVFAYEPNPRAANMLARSAMMNWMHERIVIRDVAIGETRSTAQLRFAAARLGDAALVRTGAGSAVLDRSMALVEEVKQVDVQVTTLDDEFPIDIPIRVLKIDAEGFESQVLARASRLFKSGCIDFVMVEAVEEVSGLAWAPLLRSLETLCALGYEPHVFERDGAIKATQVTRVARAGGRRSRNIVLKRAGARGI